jgi:hypothetical protein
MKGKANKISFEQQGVPNMGKVDYGRALELKEHYSTAIRKQLVKSKEKFSTFSSIKALIKKENTNNIQEYVSDTISRFFSQKLAANMALKISEISAADVSRLQKSMIFKILPYTLGVIGLTVMLILIAFTRPFLITNLELQIKLAASLLFIGMIIFGQQNRSKIKFDMLATNVLYQASAAYFTAKMQGKGKVAAMQNLDELNRRAQAEAAKEKASKKKKA